MKSCLLTFEINQVEIAYYEHAITPVPGIDVTSNVRGPCCDCCVAMAKGNANPALAGSAYRLTVSGYGPAFTRTTRVGVGPCIVAAIESVISTIRISNAPAPTTSNILCIVLDIFTTQY